MEHTMNTSKSSSALPRILAVVMVILLAGLLRGRAAATLNIDFDENDYIHAGQMYAALIRAGDWKGFLNTNYRTEHPPLAKIAYAISFLTVPAEPLIEDEPLNTITPPPESLPPNLKRAGRTTAAIFGTMQAGLMAWMNPMAGFLLAIHGFTTKYTSEIMLDGLASMLSVATALFYYRSKKVAGKSRTRWLILSAIGLGLAADTKYLHSLVGFAILIDWFLLARKEGDLRTFFKQAFLWGLLSVAVFFVCNPYLWADPVGRMQESIASIQFTTASPAVEASNYPFWQPLVWILLSPTAWQAGPYVFALDALIAVLGFMGLARQRRKEPFFFIWFVVALVILLVWRTKWTQYILVLTAPLCLAAAEAIDQGWENVQERWSRLGQKTRASYNPREVSRSIPWLVPGLMIFLSFTLFPLIFQFAISLTDFNSISIKDGLNGGVWREVWEGLSGKAAAVNPEFPFRSKEVRYIGPSSYLPVFDWITVDGILVFNILWTILSVSLQTILGVGAALLLWNKRIRFRRAWQTLFILPWAVPEMIGALMWMTIFAPVFGWVALAVQDFGKDLPLAALNDWASSPNTTLLVLLIVGVWYGFPFMMLAAAAGLKQVPVDVFDAAAMDGANTWQTLRHVTWPLLMPLVLPAVIIRGIFAFNQFYLMQIFGFMHPNYYMTTLANLSYNIFNPSGFYGANGQFAVSAVLNIITLLILIVFVLLFNRWSRADEGVAYA
jgi:arabinogalactan oligomer/maltooligosaccharide transport system permease protein